MPRFSNVLKNSIIHFPMFLFLVSISLSRPCIANLFSFNNNNNNNNMFPESRSFDAVPVQKIEQFHLNSLIR